MNRLSTKRKKAAAKSQAAARRHYQLIHPTDLVLAKTIVELSEKCHYQPIDNLIRSGFSPERALNIYIAYLYAVSTRIGPKWVGAARAARLIGVSRSQVQAMARTGELPTLISKPYRFHEQDLLDWIVAQPLNPQEVKLWAPTDPDLPRKPQ
jgi:Helix-turn-helix domain